MRRVQFWMRLCVLSGLFCGLSAGLTGCGGETPQKGKGADEKEEKTEKEEKEKDEPMGMTVQEEPYGVVKDADGNEQEITQFLLNNDKGLTVTVINYGGIITSVKTKDKNGDLGEITLGFEKLDGYLGKHPYFGATVGRYANRIANGKFTLNGTEYTLATNNDPNHLHGGVKGFDKVVWDAEKVQESDRVGVKLTYTSPDGEEGYPGTLRVTVVYSITADDELKMEYEAVTDADTVLNLTNHCYWNLAGPKSGPVMKHKLMLNCDQYLPVDKTAIPTGELAAVKDTPMDFTKLTEIGSRFDQVKGEDKTGGYDHCYVCNKAANDLRMVASVEEPTSGRVMEIYTDQPGIQFYTGNFLTPDDPGEFVQHGAFCLETQHFPDSPNQPEFPSTVLKKGEVFKSTTIHRFSSKK